MPAKVKLVLKPLLSNIEVLLQKLRCACDGKIFQKFYLADTF